jgi:hypothetical protein
MIGPISGSGIDSSTSQLTARNGTSRRSAHRWRSGCQPRATAALYSPPGSGIDCSTSQLTARNGTSSSRRSGCQPPATAALYSPPGSGIDSSTSQLPTRNGTGSSRLTDGDQAVSLTQRPRSIPTKMQSVSPNAWIAASRGVID